MNINQYPSSETTSSLPSLIGTKDLLRISWNLFKKKIWLLAGIASIFILLCYPVDVFHIFFLMAIFDAENPSFSDLLLPIVLDSFLIFLWLVAFAWLSGSLTIAVREIASGQLITIRKALKDAWRIKWPLLLVTILFSLVIGGGWVLPSFFLAMPTIRRISLIWICSYIFIWYFLCICVPVCENLKGRASLSRTIELLKRHWWGVAMHVLLLWGMLVGIYLIIFSIPIPSIIRMPFSMGGVEGLFVIIAWTFSITYCFTLYTSLKTIKETSTL